MKKRTSTYPVLSIGPETIDVFVCSSIGQVKEKVTYSAGLQMRLYKFFTSYPHKLWKMCFRRRILKALCISLCLAALVGCSGKATRTGPHPELISGTPEEVRKTLGQPTEVSRTPENRILWFYKPSWKLIPGNSGTVVVEFDNGRVAKVFKLN
jgi:hypothetical protein